jgi:TRAP-type mannitol/chloroaromatic compound transport system substrate-binding protein
MFHSHIGYYESKSPAFFFYSGVPFGFAVNELTAWVRFGGGQELWDASCEPFDIKPLFCCTTGTQMGGWFLNEITSTEGLKGLRYRMAGPGAEVYRRLGATVVLLAPADIVPSLQSGAIDACEWIGPWLDMAMGLHEVAGYYYYPGWHEPGGALTLGINKGVWNSLEESDRQLIEVAAAGEYAISLAEFNANNALALAKLRAGGNVKFRKFDDALLRTFAVLSKEVIAEAGTRDESTAKIYRSYMGFRDLVRDWSAIADGAYFDIRAFG